MSTSEENQETTSDNTTSAADNTWHERPDADKIPCPALLTFYNNGLLNPDKHGNVATNQLNDVLAGVGISADVRKTLVKGADETDEIPDSFNLFALHDSKLDHTGSIGIRDPHFNPDKLENVLLRFSEKGRMSAEHFAAAANYARREDPGLKGTIIETLELTALLEVFGRVDESTKKRYLTVDDVKGLWNDGKLPKGWQARPANDIGVDDVIAGVTEMAVKRLLQLFGI